MLPVKVLLAMVRVPCPSLSMAPPTAPPTQTCPLETKQPFPPCPRLCAKVLPVIETEDLLLAMAPPKPRPPLSLPRASLAVKVQPVTVRPAPFSLAMAPPCARLPQSELPRAWLLDRT